MTPSGANSSPSMTGRVVGGSSVKVEPLFPAARLVRGAVLEAEACVQEAEARVARAEEEARAIMEQAAERAREAEARAELRGMEKGLARWSEQLAGLTAQWQSLHERVGDELLAAGVEVARAVIGSELRQHPEAIRTIVDSVLQETSLSRRVQIRVSPADYPHLAEASVRALATARGAGEVQLGVDDTLERGDVRIEFESGASYQGGVSSRLRRVRHREGDA